MHCKLSSIVFGVCLPYHNNKKAQLTLTNARDAKSMLKIVPIQRENKLQTT